jgi:putative endonuclease
MPFYTYILYSQKLDRYYIGSCENVNERLNEQHNAVRNTSTKTEIPCVLKYSEEFNTRSEAINREKAIKNKKNRKHIEWLNSETAI